MTKVTHLNKKWLSISIGIPAHNEEASIGYAIRSIAQQKRRSWMLNNVFVICDGCSDHTSGKVISLRRKYKWITLIDDKKHLGKTARLNQLHKLNKSDILIYMDADTVLGNDSIENLVQHFINPNVGMACGNKIPTPPRTLVEKLVDVWYEYFYLIRKSLSHGDNVYNATSCYTAIRGVVAKKFRYPASLLSSGAYSYFEIKKRNLSFVFVAEAKIYFRSPATLSEYYLQITRNTEDQKYCAKAFGKSIYRYYLISWAFKVKALLQMIEKEHWAMPLSILFNIYTNWRAASMKEGKKTFWEVVHSTKQPIKI